MRGGEKALAGKVVVTVRESQVDRAARAAVEAHAGQVDKAGVPYILHVARVACAVAEDLEACAVAWLHDTAEDTSATVAQLRARHALSEAQAEALGLLTKENGRNHGEYVREIREAEGRAGEIARRVKLADVYDNIGRIPADEEWSERLVAKYARALRILEGTE